MRVCGSLIINKVRFSDNVSSADGRIRHFIDGKFVSKKTWHLEIAKARAALAHAHARGEDAEGGK